LQEILEASVEQLAEALERLCSDAKLAARLASAGRAKVLREFDYERTAEQLEKLFARMLTAGDAQAAS